MCNAVGHHSYRAILSAFEPSKLSKCQKNAPLVRYFNTYLLVITANALKYKYTRLREYITVSDVVTCIGVITPVYYPSLVFLADKSRDFLGLEMYAYEHTSSTKNAGTHTHESVSARRGMHETAKKKPSSPTRRHTTLEKSKKDVRTKVILGFYSEFKVSRKP